MCHLFFSATGDLLVTREVDSVGACLESPFEATEHSVLTDQYYVHWRPVTRGDEETIMWFPAGVSKYVAGCNHLD